MLPRTPLLLICLAAACCTRLPAGDWPQILGPDRSGVAAKSERLFDRWADGGPTLLWERPAGPGVAGVAVSGDRGILFHRDGDSEVVEAFDPATGKPLWRDSYPTTFAPQVGGEDGPLCVPTIAADRVATFGAQGVLSCYALREGTLLWRRRTHDDFDAREGYFGAGSSPLIHQGLVIVNVGGFRSQASVVAFDLRTGETVWHAFDDHASYSSPRIVPLEGTPRLIVETRMHLLGMAPESGEILFQIPYGARGPTVTAANPVVLDKHLFLTANYGIGALLAQRSDAPHEVWRGDELFTSQYCTPTPYNGVLFGVDGRQDGPPGELKCFDPEARKVLWSVPTFGYGTLILADGKLLILKTDGTLLLASANQERYDPLSEARVLRGTARALPALASGRLFIRDELTLKCLAVGPAASPESAP